MDDFDDCFEPLTESELTAAQAGDDAPKDEGVCEMPVPSNAPPMPSEHPKLGKPSARWPYNYRDASGLNGFRSSPQRDQHSEPRSHGITVTRNQTSKLEIT